MQLEKQAEALLNDWEAVDSQERAFRRKHVNVLDKLEDFASSKARIESTVKALFAEMTNGPPDGWDKTATAARGVAFRVEVQFKRKADGYDPSKLPAAVLKLDGVIKALDPKAIDAVAGQYDVADARVPGEWLAPVVLIKART